MDYSQKFFKKTREAKRWPARRPGGYIKKNMYSGGWGAHKKNIFKKSRQKNFPNPSHGSVVGGGWGYSICKVLLKKKCCWGFFLALGWRGNK